jgi:hypothetical protein
LKILQFKRRKKTVLFRENFVQGYTLLKKLTKKREATGEYQKLFAKADFAKDDFKKIA